MPKKNWRLICVVEVDGQVVTYFKAVESNSYWIRDMATQEAREIKPSPATKAWLEAQQ